MINLVSKVEHFGKLRSYGVVEITNRSAPSEMVFPAQQFPHFFCCWWGFHNTADGRAEPSNASAGLLAHDLVNTFFASHQHLLS
jgi:hypothetical protein